MKENDYSLFDRLNLLYESDQYPFHMPGHKRSDRAEMPCGLARLDITEIEGFDNLHHPEGILKEAMNHAAKLYHSEETCFLVNGSSCGILAAVSAAAGEGQTLILCRNAHISAYNAAYLRDLRIKSLYPQLTEGGGMYGAVTPEAVKQALSEATEAGAVLITSPTYDGFVSDIRKIVEIVHSYGKILIVDEAHGAHFGLDPRMPESSVGCGADLVIQSLHKTLPSLTQTALLHINGNRVDREKVRRFLRIYQTSSPSYLLMGSIDHCIRIMEEHGKEWFDRFFRYRDTFMESVRDLRHLRVADEDFCTGNGMKASDPGKLVIMTGSSGYTGAQLQNLLLERYHLQLEMAGLCHAVAIITVMDDQEGFERLSRALHELDAQCPGIGKKSERTVCPAELLEKLPHATADASGQPSFTMKQAMDAGNTEMVVLEQSCRRIAAETVYVYPPGIPVLIPGERITDSVIKLIREYQKNHLQVQGLSGRTGSAVRCLK